MSPLLPIGFNFFILIVYLIYNFKNPKKAALALKHAKGSIKKILPLILFFIILLIFIEDLIPQRFIEDAVQTVTKFSGFLGIFIATIVGSLLHIPHFISYSIGGELLQSGVEPGIVAALISSFIMIHTFTIPIEIKELGLKFTLARNLLSFFFIIIISVIFSLVY